MELKRKEVREAVTSCNDFYSIDSYREERDQIDLEDLERAIVKFRMHGVDTVEISRREHGNYDDEYYCVDYRLMGISKRPETDEEFEKRRLEEEARNSLDAEEKAELKRLLTKYGSPRLASQLCR